MASSITDLPGPAQRALGHLLPPQAVRACRLAHPALSAVSGPSHPRLWVVARTFQRQTQSADAAEGKDGLETLLTERSLAAEAARAPAADVLVDVRCPCPEHTWRRLFGALLGPGSSVSSVSLTEFLPSRTEVADPSGPPQSTWLRALVKQQQQVAAAGGGGSLRSLSLQLLVPLPDQALLLQLTSLASLAISAAPAWLLRSWPAAHCDAVSIQLLWRLHELPRLSSLTCSLGGSSTVDLSQAVTGLHAGLLQLGSRLTHLSIGSSRFRPVGFGLSAPWRDMPALQSLVCGTGCNLELPAAAGYSSDGSGSDDDQQQQQRGGSSGQGAAAAAAPPVQLLPALTSLLLEGLQDDPESLLMALAGAPAACSQLQRLKLPRLSSSGYDDFLDRPAYVLQNYLPKLRGLQELDASIRGRSQVDALAGAVGALPALRGLTLLIDNADSAAVYDDFDDLPLQPELLALRLVLDNVPQRLRALKMVATPGVVFDLAADLSTAAAAERLSGLEQLSYTGPILALPGTGCRLSPGLLPSGLQGLTLLARQPGVDNSVTGMPFEAESKGFVFTGASLLTGLTSLRLGGMQTQWAAAGTDGGLAAGPLCWHLLPPCLRELELDLAPLDDRLGAAPAPAGGFVLDSLQSLTLRIAGGGTDCRLSALWPQLAAATALTYLHVSSKQPCAQPGANLGSLRALRGLRVFTLDVRLEEEEDEEEDVAAAGALAFVHKVCASLAGHVDALRILRLPALAAAGRLGAQLLEARLPNCLVMDADERRATGVGGL